MWCRTICGCSTRLSSTASQASSRLGCVKTNQFCCVARRRRRRRRHRCHVHHQHLKPPPAPRTPPSPPTLSCGRYQTRCVRTFPDGQGYALASIEGRVAIEYFSADDEAKKVTYACQPPKPNQRLTLAAAQTHHAATSHGITLPHLPPPPTTTTSQYAFKCHRVQQTVFPVNSIAFHPLHGTFATGGKLRTKGDSSRPRPPPYSPFPPRQSNSQPGTTRQPPQPLATCSLPPTFDRQPTTTPQAVMVS